MPTNTYIALDSVTVTTATPSITLTGISGAYTDLVLVIGNLTNSSASSLYMRLNGDTGTNYSSTLVNGNGTSTVSQRTTSTANGLFIGAAISGLPSSSPATVIVNLMSYANTTTNKTVINRYSAASGDVEAAVGLWRNTSAITSITVRNTGGNISVGSTFSLYAIKSE
jgi:hypothetical protein